MKTSLRIFSTAAATAVVSLAAPALAGAALWGAPTTVTTVTGVLNSTACTPAGTLDTYLSAWGDNALYGVAPNGTFEAGVGGWTLSGAAIVKGGNTAALKGLAKGSKALEVSSGGSAISPAFCATSDTPTLRYFATTKSPSGSIDAFLLYTNAAGKVVEKELGIAAVNYVGGWMPASSKPLSIALPILVGQTTPVRLKFTADGWNAKFQVDDIYIDPYRRG